MIQYWSLKQSPCLLWKKGLKKFCVDNRLSCNIGAGGILQTLFVWFRFLEIGSVLWIDRICRQICSKGVKGWKHQEAFLKLIWRDSGQVDWKFMCFEGGQYSTDAVWARCASVTLRSSGFMKGERTTLLVGMQLWEARCEMSLHCMQFFCCAGTTTTMKIKNIKMRTWRPSACCVRAVFFCFCVIAHTNNQRPEVENYPIGKEKHGSKPPFWGSSRCFLGLYTQQRHS